MNNRRGLPCPLLMTLPNQSRQTVAARITELLAKSSPPEYDQLALDLLELTHLVRQQVAAKLAPALKKRMLEQPHHSYADKQYLTKWVNAELRRHGLAVQWTAKKPIEGGYEERIYPACLVTDLGNHSKEGRFQVRYRDETGKHMRGLSTPELSVLLDHFEVMIDDPDRHRTGKWTARGRSYAQRIVAGEDRAN